MKKLRKFLEGRFEIENMYHLIAKDINDERVLFQSTAVIRFIEEFSIIEKDSLEFFTKEEVKTEFIDGNEKNNAFLKRVGELHASKIYEEALNIKKRLSEFKNITNEIDINSEIERLTYKLLQDRTKIFADVVALDINIKSKESELLGKSKSFFLSDKISDLELFKVNDDRFENKISEDFFIIKEFSEEEKSKFFNLAVNS